MAAALKFCGQKGIDQLHSQALPHHTLPEGEDVGVIVGSCHAGAEGIGAAAGPDTLHLIGGDGHPHAGTADENSSLGVSVPQIAGHLGGLFGVIALFTGLVDAEILDLVAQFQQMRLYGVLQGQGGVVAAYDDLHITTLLWCKIYLVYAGARGGSWGKCPAFWGRGGLGGLRPDEHEKRRFFTRLFSAVRPGSWHWPGGDSRAQRPPGKLPPLKAA